MQQPQVVDGLLLPADQKTPEPVHPTVSALDHPAARSVARFLLDSLRLLAARPQVQREAELFGKLDSLASSRTESKS